MVDEHDPGGGRRAAPGVSTLPGDDALAPTEHGGIATPNQDTIVPAGHEGQAPLSLPAAGYQLGELIGRGGMGEVMAAHDQRIGREVAIKRMRTAAPDGEQLARFLREARIQARLDHPAIVPVHELGTDEAGRPYFTMKRVSGKTLAQRMTEGVTLQALLRALVDVCLAIDLAHARARDPSRSQAGEHHARRLRRGLRARLGRRAGVDRHDPGDLRGHRDARWRHADRRDARHPRLHGAGADARPRRDPARGCLRARGDPVRDARG